MTAVVERHTSFTEDDFCVLKVSFGVISSLLGAGGRSGTLPGPIGHLTQKKTKKRSEKLSHLQVFLCLLLALGYVGAYLEALELSEGDLVSIGNNDFS